MFVIKNPKGQYLTKDLGFSWNVSNAVSYMSRSFAEDVAKDFKDCYVEITL